MRFGVLGPLVASDDRGPIDLKGPRHRAVLARLLIARGRVVPVDMLVADLWEDPPDGAVGAVQTFIGALRRALEPSRPPRAPASVLVTSGPGYALRASSVDAWEFEDALGGSLSDLDSALALWRGPAYAEFADQAWARAEISRLDELRLLAVERRAEALMALGRAAEAVADLQAHVDSHPWREDGWRLLALALYRAGRQGEALESLRRARVVLSSELGLDPGPALRQLEADVLAQAPQLLPVRADSGLVGRSAEMAQLVAAAGSVVQARKLGLALVSGEAGAGKTALATAFRDRLRAEGWATQWEGNTEDTQSAWPHVHGDSAGDPAAARFQRYQAFRSRLGSAVPLLIVLDDLHWAGAESLALLASVVVDPVAAPVLVVGTYRSTDAPTAFLGRVARSEPTRVYLGGLAVSDVTAVVRAAVGMDVDSPTAAVIHRRSGGNPFFVRELARLLATEGDLSSVPAGVLDVVRYRLAQLPDDVQSVLRTAAVAGDSFTLDVVGPLDAVETAVRQGFLVEVAAGSFRFAHALVRDALYRDLSRSRRARLHSEVGQTIERVRPGDAAALAHHFWLASDGDRAGRYARIAAEQAEARFAFGAAARLWRISLDTATDIRDRLESMMGLVRALSFAGSLDQARALRGTALDLLSDVDDAGLAARVIASFDVPAIWTTADDLGLASRVAGAVERVLPSVSSPGARSRLLATLAMELRSSGGPRAVQAAAEAEELARGVDDPAVLAFALNAQFMQSFTRAGRARERVRIGTELVGLASRNSLVTFQVLGHLILTQAYSALASFTDADSHAAAVSRLGTDHEIPLVDVFVQWYRALRASVAGSAEAYPAAGRALAEAGMPGFDRGMLSFALLCHEVHNGLPVDRSRDFGGFTPWCVPGVRIPESPRDLLFEARTCLHAAAAVEAGDRPAMERLYEELLPASDELAGAGSGMLTLGPVACYLGELAQALGRDEAAAAHRAQAEAVASLAGS